MNKKLSQNLIFIALIAGIVCGLLFQEFKFFLLNPMLTLIGQIFLKLLKMIVVPLVFFSILTAMCSFHNLRNLRRIALRTIMFFIVFTLLAIVSGMVAAEIAQPGEGASITKNLQTISVTQPKPEIKKIAFKDFILNIIPDNPFESLAKGNLLAIIFFAVFLGTAIASLKPESREPLLNLFEKLNMALIKMVRMIMQVAPAGVFALICTAITQSGSSLLGALLNYTLLTAGVMAFYLFTVYPTAIKIFTPFSPFIFFKKFRPVILLGFSTSSSNATLPENMLISEQELKIDRKIVSFVLPLGATINMSGTAIYQGISAIFIAQLFALNLNLWQQLTLIFTAITAAVGTAGVPGSGIVTLTIVLEATGIPSAGIALILGVERILDMCRTVLNVSGDTVTALIVNHLEDKRKSKKNRSDEEQI